MQIPDTAPFTPEQRQALLAFLPTLSPLQAGWLGGFLAGAFQGAAAAVGAPGPQDKLFSVHVLYGTESGNSEELAARDTKALRALGYDATLVNMADANLGVLHDATNILVIVSTWGDGEPPDAIRSFHSALLSDSAPRLDHARFSVCALGDTTYEKFCQCGREFDERFAALGGHRLADRQECDVDFDETHAAWFARVLAELDQLHTAAAAGAPAARAIFPAEPSVKPYSKKNPFSSPVKRKFLLSGKGSEKEIWHVELGLDGPGLDYEPGDTIALLPKNAPDVVGTVAAAGRMDLGQSVTLKDLGVITLEEAMTTHLDITGLSPVVMSKYNELAKSAKLGKLLDPANKSKLQSYLKGRQLIDLLEDYPLPGLSGDDFVGLVRRLPPRLYSIASSLKAHPGEAHLTIAAVRYLSYGRARKGVASTFVPDLLRDRISQVDVYTHHNNNFKLPRSGDTPVIMVGPGTGVAPYRSFVEERAANGDKGPMWLIFGDRRYNFDFLYQLEWQDHLKNGTLTHLDVAFSRDQPEKIYVQHRMREQAARLWAWLEEGAHFYVCGDATRMAPDVHEALLGCIMTAGGLDRARAESYVENLKKAKRYQRDVY